MLMLVSFLGSLAMIVVALAVMWGALAPAFPRMVVALDGSLSLSPLPAWQRRQNASAVRTVRFNRPALRAAA